MTALVLGGLALLAAACGGGSGSSSTGAGPTGSSTTAAAGAVVTTASVGGRPVLASTDGHTLYQALGESAGHIRCVQGCTGVWEPVMASQRQLRTTGSPLAAKLTVLPRPDGGTQLAYAGHPLYTFALEGPHQMHGNGVTDEFSGAHFRWSAVTVDSASSAPPRMGSKPTDVGGGGYGY
jgi:predicted lipoprotein with Yx(FWY)xxD motif